MLPNGFGELEFVNQNDQKDSSILEKISWYEVNGKREETKNKIAQLEKMTIRYGPKQ